MFLNAPRHRRCALDLMVHRTYAVMAALYLKGVAPPHVTLNQIFGGVMPFMAIQLLAVVLLYLLPQIGLWLPRTSYG
jgi:TRAP-type mannitol/chloroaromatic compound transport system permease large subunit